MDTVSADATIEKLLRQQSALASFGSFAFREDDLEKVLNEASRICAGCLGAPYAKVCEYRPDTDDLLIVAGYGWHTGVVGHVISRADTTSPQGRAFITGEPVISELVREAHFTLPPFYGDHGIVSTVDVLIKGEGKPFGVLEIDNDKQRDYDQRDVEFLTGFANVLAESVGTANRTKVLRTAIDRMKALVEEKDILSEEVQHRVRNNLHLIYGMLTQQLMHWEADNAKDGIKSVARRVMTLAQVYDHLLGTGMSRTINFGDYLKSLCVNLSALQENGQIELTCRADPVVLGLDGVTTLGLVVAEVVSNSYGHAFPSGSGHVAIDLRSSDQAGDATLTISDDGIGLEDKGDSKRHGLGLVRRLGEQLGGSVEVRSKPGTTWTIVFPVAGNQA